MATAYRRSTVNLLHNILNSGGVMIWPLLGLSVLALGVIMERILVFSTTKLPDQALENDLCQALHHNDTTRALQELQEKSPLVLPMVKAIFDVQNNETRDRERLAQIAGRDALHTLDNHLSFLAVTARVAPLMGLLGTVLGMIQTFSRMSQAQGAVDMTALAGGIWQALLTTAAGLAVAIPALFAHQYFIRRREQTAYSLQRLANLLLAQKG